MGTVFRQKGRSTWMLKYYRDGRAIYESSRHRRQGRRAEHAEAARGRDRERRARLEQDGQTPLRGGAEDLVNDYKVNDRRSLDELERRLKKHLEPFFGGRRIVDHHDGRRPRRTSRSGWPTHHRPQGAHRRRGGRHAAGLERRDQPRADGAETHVHACDAGGEDPAPAAHPDAEGGQRAGRVLRARPVRERPAATCRRSCGRS